MLNNLEITVHDCYVDIYDKEPSINEINSIVSKLPQNIVALANTWGGSDTEVREKIYEWLMKNCLVTSNLKHNKTTEQELMNMIPTSDLEDDKIIRSLMKPYLKRLIMEYYKSNDSTELDELELSFMVCTIPDRIITLIREHGENEIKIKNEIEHWIETSNPRQVYSKYKNKKMNLF